MTRAALAPRALVRRAVDWWALRGRRLLRLWSMGIMACVIVNVASVAGYFESSQARAMDFLLQLRGEKPATEVVVVAVDDPAFARLQERQPLPRDYLARVVHGLRRAGASTVALDFDLRTPTPEDGLLAAAIDAFAEDGRRRVIVPSVPSSGALADLVRAGRAELASPLVMEDGDLLVRSTALFVREGAAVLPSLGALTAARHRGVSADELWDRTIGVRPTEPVRVNFLGPRATILTLPSDTVAGLAEGALPHATPLAGKAVLVGATFVESRDFFRTPHGLLPGVEVHATVAHMALTGRYIRESAWRLALALQLAAVIGVGIVMVTATSWKGQALSFGVPLVLALPASYYAFESGGYWLDFVLPVAAANLVGTLSERFERRRVLAAFGRYLSKDLMDEVLRDASALRGARREVSILFADLRNFTSIAETTAPEAIARQMSDYFDAMGAVIGKHRGMVNDFVGDGIMAVFNAPVNDPDHARHAVECALAMQVTLEQLNGRWAAVARPPLSAGVAVHTGMVFAGNVGGRTRTKYAVVGDVVNVASRVENLNKELGTAILITDATRAALAVPMPTRNVGSLVVRGRQAPVTVYEVLAPAVPGVPVEVTA